MEHTSVASLEKLPVELLHCILDFLDTSTIIFRIRLVSKRFRSIATTYDRYKLDLQSASALTLRAYCRLIRPFNIISLIVSDDARSPRLTDQFISLAHLRQFTRLQSITLLNITEGQMNLILKRVNTNRIQSCSIQLSGRDDRRKKTTKQLLQSILANPRLCRLEIGSFSKRIDYLSWPVSCCLRKWLIDDSISFPNLCSVLDNCPFLNTVVLKEKAKLIFDKTSKKPSDSTSYPQIRSLAIENFDFTMEQLELMLSCTPSMYHLRLISKYQSLDGQRWENFVQVNLPYLENFEFDFYGSRSNKIILEDIETCLTSFRSPFWTEHKKWFVSGTCQTAYSHIIHLYSLPNCSTVFKYQIKPPVLAVSTYPIEWHPYVPKMDHIKILQLYVDDSFMEDIKEKKLTGCIPYLSEATNIEIKLNLNTYVGSLDMIHYMIDTSKITCIQFANRTYSISCAKTSFYMNSFLSAFSNLSEFVFEDGISHPTVTTIEAMISILPAQIKYLAISVSSIDQIEIIMNRCKLLSSMKLHLRLNCFREEVIRWFSDRFTNVRCQRQYRQISIWFGKRKVQCIEAESEK